MAYELAQVIPTETVPGLTPPLDAPLDVVLCLCMDVSRSGRTLTPSDLSEIELLCTQFSEIGFQTVGFGVLRTEPELRHYADLIRAAGVRLPQAHKRISKGLSLSGALMVQVDHVLGYKFRRGAIDIGGDGPQSEDLTCASLQDVVRDLAETHGFAVNGMAIQGQSLSDDILEYYLNSVDTPLGYFNQSQDSPWTKPVLAGRSWATQATEDFVKSMIRKLSYGIAEIGSGTIRL